MTKDAAGELEAGLRRRPRLVAVEDDEDYRFVLREWLTPRYDVTFLPHGEGLFKEAERNEPALVMLDLQLPGPGGLELCRRLRRHPWMRGVQILVLTGRRDPDALLGSFEAGASAFLMKPVAKEDLLEHLEELMGVA